MSSLPRTANRPNLTLSQLESREVPTATPTGMEQEFLERLNDARANPTAYGESVGVDLSYIPASPPWAFNTSLLAAAQGHSLDMLTNRFFDHTGSNGSGPVDRIRAAGYPMPGRWSAFESIGGGFSTASSALGMLIVDAGVPSLGHRHHLLSYGTSGSHIEVGVGIAGSVDAMGNFTAYSTIDSADNGDSTPYLTGVVYRDANGNGRYDNGEGVGGATITVPGVGSVTTWGSGGYSFRTGPGTFNVTASGGSLSSPVTRAVTVGSVNARLNFTAPTGPDRIGASVTGVTYTDPRARTLSSARVTFSESIDPASFTAGDVTFSGPRGAAAITGVAAVAGTSNTQFDVAFAPQTAAGTYTLTVGPDIRDAAGNPMDQNLNGVNGEVPGDRYTATTAVSEPAAAAFVATDATTQGNWQGRVGTEGYSLAGVSSASVPTYARMTLTGQQNWTWAASTTDPRGLLKPGSTSDRVGSAWYAGSSFNVALDLTGGTRRVSLYFVDWDSTARAQRVEVLDTLTGAVLDTRDVSAFNGGRYLTWDLTGSVAFRITKTGGPNAVLSGVFFGTAGVSAPPSPPVSPPPAPPPPASPPTPPASSSGATYVGTDAATQGTWRNAYGAEGYSLAQSAASLPSYATVSVAGNLDWAWAGSTADVRGLQKAAPATDRIGATWYSNSTFSVDLTVTGGTRRVSLYFVDWDSTARGQRVEVVDRATGTVLDTQTVSGFNGGRYLTWDMAGAVTVRMTRTAGANAVLSGIFFGGPAASPPVSPPPASPPPASPPATPATSATFVSRDTSTRGNWQGRYGAEGYSLSQSAASLPGYATLGLTGNLNWTWAGSTADARALQKVAATDRLAATWYNSGSFSANLDLTGGTRRVSLYFVDWDSTARGQRVEVVDRATGAVLDSRDVTAFNGGTWLSWDLSGSLEIRMTRTAGANAVLSGVFFG